MRSTCKTVPFPRCVWLLYLQRCHASNIKCEAIPRTSNFYQKEGSILSLVIKCSILPAEQKADINARMEQSITQRRNTAEGHSTVEISLEIERRISAHDAACSLTCET